MIITGSEGGIGSSIAHRLSANGYRVIGLDLNQSEASSWDVVIYNLEDLSKDTEYEDLQAKIESVLRGDSLVGLINNAALQIVATVDELRPSDLLRSYQVNCVAPFTLTTMLLSKLRQSYGTVVNIGSIHAKLTKTGFLAYAASKAAIESITRSLALEVGQYVKVCAISPAAIQTSMLVSGFSQKSEGLSRLASYHPTNKIGGADEVAHVVELLVSRHVPFANGAIWSLDGGIAGVLHDPD